MSTLRIAEIFGPTIQGEGALIGEPTVFVRTGGCDYRCAWCDSLHAVDTSYRRTWMPMTPDAVWDRIVQLSLGKPLTVSLSGGNPGFQRGHRAGPRKRISVRLRDPGIGGKAVVCRSRYIGA